MIHIYLSAILGQKRWTQADLARKTGIRPNTINEYYHELTDRISLEHLDRICGVLNCDLSEILVRVSTDDIVKPTRYENRPKEKA